MIYTRFRKHRINMDNYESEDFGATVSFDTEVDKLPAGYDDSELPQYLDDLLDEMVETVVAQIKKAGPIRESHLYIRYSD